MGQLPDTTVVLENKAMVLPLIGVIIGPSFPRSDLKVVPMEPQVPFEVTLQTATGRLDRTWNS